MNKVMASNKCVSWETPDSVMNFLRQYFNFNDDPCPLSDNGIDGLLREWGTMTYVNPPYGRNIDKWIMKAFQESYKDKTIVMLIPSRTDTRWWHNYVMRATEVWFVKGRIKFSGSKNNAPFPNAIVIFRNGFRDPKFKSVEV